MELKVPIKEKDKTKAILKLLNPFLSNLTDKEINVVSVMIDMGIDSLTKYNRADLRDRLNMDKYSFNNFVLNLKKKGVLIQTIHDIHLNPQLKTLTNDNEYTIKFVS